MRSLNAIVPFTVVAFLFIGAMNASATSRISVERLGEKAFRVLVTSPSTMTETQARRRVMPMGAELCGGILPKLGESKLTRESNGGSTFYQDIHCQPPTSATTAGTASATNSGSTRLDDDARALHEQRARTLTRTYLEHLADKRYEAAFAQLHPRLQSYRAYPQWVGALTRWRGDPGSLKTRRLRDATTYVDPPNETPGVYVAVRFEESFEHLPLVCGFLVWSLTAVETAKIVRDAQAHIDAQRFVRMPDAQKQWFRKARGCDDG
ncbi:MAG: DUF4019 domain-containing protein [Pseudomonadota bacterium]